VASAMVRCSRLSQLSYCRQVAAARLRVMQARISAICAGVALSAAMRATSGSINRRVRITSAGLVRRTMASMSDTVAMGRVPMKVPLPTWRQICPSDSSTASACRSPARDTPSARLSSRSGGRRLSTVSWPPSI
jgi:hypothetical protein